MKRKSLCSRWQAAIYGQYALKRGQISVICSTLQRASNTNLITKNVHKVPPFYIAKLKVKAVVLPQLYCRATCSTAWPVILCHGAVCKGIQLSLHQPRSHIPNHLTLKAGSTRLILNSHAHTTCWLCYSSVIFCICYSAFSVTARPSWQGTSAPGPAQQYLC